MTIGQYIDKAIKESAERLKYSHWTVGLLIDQADQAYPLLPDCFFPLFFDQRNNPANESIDNEGIHSLTEKKR